MSEALRSWVACLRDLGVSELKAPVAKAPARTEAVRERRPQTPSPAKRPAAAPKKAPSAAPLMAGADRLFEAFDDPPPDDKPAVLTAIREDIGDCTRCKLHSGRNKIVFGVGNPEAKLLFVGEGPGRDEDLKGEPFVGRAGQKLDEMIQAIGLSREEVYIANIVKCRPPNNRDPEPDEVSTCSPFLFRQIETIRPNVIVTLGGPATSGSCSRNLRSSSLSAFAVS